MANQQSPFERIDSSEARIEAKQSESHAASPFDSLKLMSEAGKVLKSSGSKALEAFGMPSFADRANGTTATEAPARTPSREAPSRTAPENATARPKDAAALPKDGIAGQVIDRIKDSSNPVQDIKGALAKLDNLQDATVSRNGSYSHIDVNLKHGETSAPPNIQVRGFRPVASHTAPHLSFDLSYVNNGVQLTNMEGFSSSVQGPWGRIRHSETNSVFIGKDNCGQPYVNTSSELYIGRRAHASTTTLREGNFPANSPMRSAMHHPEALKEVGKALGMFQNLDNLSQLSLKRQGDAFDVKSESRAGKHVELDYQYKPEPLPITIKVASLDLDKTLSASLTQEKDSVSLGKIAGLTANVEIGGAKMSLCPTKVSLEKDMVKMELKDPRSGQTMPVEIPISKLKEAAARTK
jgi:hypothetical protein